jgi:hypothetical protein
MTKKKSKKGRRTFNTSGIPQHTSAFDKGSKAAPNTPSAHHLCETILMYSLWGNKHLRLPQNYLS